MPSRVIAKYLRVHAEPEVRAVPAHLGQWRHVVCIPAFDEADSLQTTLSSLADAARSADALTIVVVNAREDASDVEHRGNTETLCQLHSLGATEAPISWGSLNGMGLLVVDRATGGRRLPPGQGVGLARKIGCDIALSLIAQGQLTGDWIRSTDADVAVPHDFFGQLIDLPAEASAAIAPFIHIPEGDALQRRCMALYEAYLQSYVDGLKSAGSPYAFHTIGSLISVRAQSYAVVRGIPKRQAGEDFYLLNKLAKVGCVVSLEGEPVRIRGRLSLRVPFGTGQALKAFRSAVEQGQPTRRYDPSLFEGLRCWLEALERFVAAPEVDQLRASIEQIGPPLGPELLEALTDMGAFASAHKASLQVGGPQLRHRLMEWNDGFRTLKLIHALREARILEG